MGDTSTHAVFYQGYWHFTVLEHKKWVRTGDFTYLCDKGDEDAVVKLER